MTDDRDALIDHFSMLKPIILSAPFHRAYNEHSQLASKHKSTFQPGMADQAPEERGELMIIHYREEEAIYVQAANDRVTIVISTLFTDETDRVFGKVFLQVSARGPSGCFPSATNCDLFGGGLGIRGCSSTFFGDRHCASGHVHDPRSSPRGSKCTWDRRSKAVRGRRLDYFWYVPKQITCGHMADPMFRSSQSYSLGISRPLKLLLILRSSSSFSGTTFIITLKLARRECDLLEIRWNIVLKLTHHRSPQLHAFPNESKGSQLPADPQQSQAGSHSG